MSKIDELFQQEVQVINLGLGGFADDLRQQDVTVMYIDWRPVAGGNKKTQALLARIRRGKERSG